MIQSTQSIKDLPESAQIVAEIIGREATLKIAQVCSHRQFYVPKNNPRGNNWIADLIGDQSFKKLQYHFGGCLVDLAGCSSIIKRERNKLIIEAHKTLGWSTSSIAMALEVSERTIQRVINP